MCFKYIYLYIRIYVFLSIDGRQMLILAEKTERQNSPLANNSLEEEVGEASLSALFAALTKGTYCS